MTRLTPTHWKKLKCVFERLGFEYERTHGDHCIMRKPGVPRPVVIKMVENVGKDIIKANLRTANATLEEYLELLKGC